MESRKMIADLQGSKVATDAKNRLVDSGEGKGRMA